MIISTPAVVKRYLLKQLRKKKLNLSCYNSYCNSKTVFQLL